MDSDVLGMIKADHIKDKVRTTLDVDPKKKTANASVVVSHEGIMPGIIIFVRCFLHLSSVARILFVC